MKRSTYFMLVTIPLAMACLKEEKIDVAKPETFQRYYSDGYDNEAIQVEQTYDGGFVILANQSFRNSDAAGIKSNIVVITTDGFGNLIDRWYYPNQFPTTALAEGYVGSSLSLLPDSSGYLIVGQKIQENNAVQGQIKSDLLVMAIRKTDGTPFYEEVIPDPTRNVAGKAGAIIADTTALILSSDLDSKNIILTEFDLNVDDNSVTTLTALWSTTSDQVGTILPLNKLFYIDTPTPNIITAGDGVQLNSTSDIYLSRTKPNNVITENFVPIGSPSLNEFANDFCRIGGEFAFTGETSSNGGDIVYYKTTRDGIVNQSKVFVNEIFDKRVPATGNTQREYGNSIVATAEGGLIILGTVSTYPGGDLGRGDTDMILLKINALGGKQWSKTYGSIGIDRGQCIRQTTDRGFILLGTTILGNRATISLIKTDSDGNINPE